MNPVPKTIVFVAIAVACVGLAFVVQSFTGEPVRSDEAEVGAYFYTDPDDKDEPAFVDPADALSLQLATYDDEAEELETFRVVREENGWVLRDFNGYPADADTQLARTLTSVSFVKREAVQSRRESDHARLGVLDPLDEETYGEEGHGDRITIKGENDTLADLIIGNPVPDSSVANLHYVRRADQPIVYRAVVDLDVSTRFRDWINDDLLALDPANDVSAVRVDDLDEPDEDETPEEKARREAREREKAERMTPGVIVRLESEPPPVGATGPLAFDVLELARDDANADWHLAGLDEEREDFVKAPVDSMVRTLERLKIVGVRRKPDSLNADLTINVPNPAFQGAVIASIRNDLRSRGFDVAANEEGDVVFVSRFGKLTAATNTGVVYDLHFGNEFRGSERQLQIGDTEPAGDVGIDETQEGRYLVVRARFDEQYVAGKPVKPEAPVKPATLDEPAPEKEDPPKEDPPKPGENGDAPADPSDDAGDAASDDADPDATGEEDPAADDPPADPEPQPTDEGTDPEGTDPGEPPKAPEPTREQLQQKYDAEMVLYQKQLERYEENLAQWQKQADRGRDRATVLNERFGEWYYVITADDFGELSIERSDLVERKPPPPEPPKTEDPKPGDPMPGDPKPVDPDTPKPDEPKPDDPKPDDPKPDEPKPNEPKPENPKPVAPKPDDPKPDEPAPGDPEPTPPE